MQKHKAIPFEIIHLNDQGYHLKIKARINGTEASFILDTGASQTAFDLHFVKLIIPENKIEVTEQVSSGLGTNNMLSYEVLIDSFQIGEHKFENYSVAVLDLSHVNNTYQKLGIDDIHGILGNDILYKFKALIDYKNLQLWLER
jgi:predicted aspartyl protease